MDDDAWWRDAVIYQIYVRSFQDSDGDGYGDLRGILARLDHLEWLGVDALWLTPIHPSPWRDGGYDIDDFTDVHPAIGTLDDFRELLDALHERGMRLVLDFVPNHTSDRHPWFLEARSGRDSPRRDWYVWADPRPDGGLPNNWLSVFGGSAWQFDESSGQYFYHAFLPEQPDLNWRNPAVREAMLELARLWLDRGVDGFRIDAIDMLYEDEELRDNPRNDDFDPDRDAPDREVHQTYTRDLPEVHDVAARFRDIAAPYGDRVLIGELYVPSERLVEYYGTPGRPELHLPLQLDLLWTDWHAGEFVETIEHYLDLVPEHGWPAWSLGNHDRSRLASRSGPEQARVAAMLLLTLRGTPTMYYGDEIGMYDVPVPEHRSEDPQARVRPGMSRDVARTPMQWDEAAPHFAFTTGEPWLPTPDAAEPVTVAAQTTDPHSLLQLHRRLLAVRRETPALRRGRHVHIEKHEPVVGYIRELGGERILVLLNMSDAEFEFDFSRHGPRGTVLVDAWLVRQNETVEGTVLLHGNDGVVLRLADG